MIGYIMSLKFKKCLLFTGIIIFIFTAIQFQPFYKSHHSQRHVQYDNVNILWWTPFSHKNELEDIHCGDYVCGLTDNRKYIDNISVFLFYGSNFDYSDLPLPRLNHHVWALLHEESPKNVALFLHNEGLNLFNISSTFSRYSNYPITLQHLPSISALTDTTHYLPIEQKNALLSDLAPILYIQSDCETPINRDSYVAELMKYIQVDSYGSCLNNKKLPESLTKDPLENLYSVDFLDFVAQYKFTLAFENAVCDDYITEKLWRPIMAGSIPIYMGSPTIQDWLPNNMTAIIASDFSGPKDLAEYILKVNANDELYENYMQHKFRKTIDNDLLSDTMRERTWNDDHSFIHSYECFVCENMHKKTRLSSVNTDHYFCPEPVSSITKVANASNWWTWHWTDGKCEAKLLKKLLMSNRNFTKEMFNDEIKKLKLKDDCL